MFYLRLGVMSKFYLKNMFNLGMCISITGKGFPTYLGVSLKRKKIVVHVFSIFRNFKNFFLSIELRKLKF